MAMIRLIFTLVLIANVQGVTISEDFDENGDIPADIYTTDELAIVANSGELGMPLEGENADTALGSRSCCAPDVIFVVDITEGSGFSRQEADDHLTEFMVETFNRVHTDLCDDVRVAIIEYGTKARLRWSFKRYTRGNQIRSQLASYRSGTPIGDLNHARSGFTAVRVLLEKPKYGKRPGSPTWVFWLTKSDPHQVNILHSYVNTIIKPRAMVVVIAITRNVNYQRVRYIGSGRDFDFWVTDIIFLTGVCSKFNFYWCDEDIPQTTTRRLPDPTTATTTTTTTTTTRRPTTTTTRRPTTTTTRRRPTTTTTRRRPTTTTTCEETTAPPTTCEETTLPNPTTPLPPSDFCWECRSRRNHKDLYADTSDCHFYYQCFYYNETYAMGIRRPCAANMFWHDEILQCMPEGEVPCVDLCREDTTHSRGCYAGDGCRQFFVCANTASYGMCCPSGTNFNPSTCACDENELCQDFCEMSAPPVRTTVAPSSQFNATVCQDSFGTYISIVPREPNAYILIDQDGLATEKQFCPDLVAFDLDTCRCNTELGVTRPTLSPVCRAHLWLPFDVDFQDQSIFSYTTFAYGDAQISSNAAHGSGSLRVVNGRVEIPGLKTFDMRASGSWCAFFNCDGGCNGGVFGNNKDNTDSEYTVIMGANGNQFSSRVNFWHPVGGRSLSGQISTPANNWNHVCVTYDGNAVKMRLNGQTVDSEFVGGFLSIAHCPYTVGNDQSLGSFNGWIDQVLVAECALTEDQMTAHQTGNMADLSSLGI